MKKQLHIFVDVENIRRTLSVVAVPGHQAALNVRFLAKHIATRLGQLDSPIEYEVGQGGIVALSGNTKEALKDRDSQAGMRLQQLKAYWNGDDGLVRVRTFQVKTRVLECPIHKRPCLCPVDRHVVEVKKQQRVDVAMAVEIVVASHSYPNDTFVLASADSDFYPALKHVKSIRPEDSKAVATFGETRVDKEIRYLKMPGDDSDFLQRIIEWLPLAGKARVTGA